MTATSTTAPPAHAAPVWQRAVFAALAVGSLAPVVSAPIALVSGVAFALLWGNPFAAATKLWTPRLLQVSVVGLGAGMNLAVVARVGAQGLGQTALGLVVTLSLALALAALLKTEATTSLLIGVGTAICGGSAIAAVAPAVGAKSHQTSVSLSVVFLLNAAALVVFPKAGSVLGLSQGQFGLWSALAIHDTSSVVGASMVFGPEALAVGTTVKLARALWIVPVALVLARTWPKAADAQGGTPKTKVPYFIFGFIAVAALVTWVPVLQGAGALASDLARRALVVTLFLVGAGVSRDALKVVGPRPLVLGVVLWALVAGASLFAIHAGWLTVPELR